MVKTEMEKSLEGEGMVGEFDTRDRCGWPEGSGSWYEIESVLMVKGGATRGVEFGGEASKRLLRGEDSGEGETEEVEQDDVEEAEEDEVDEMRLCWVEEEEIPVLCKGCVCWCCAMSDDRLEWHMLQAVDPIWHLWHFSLTNPRRQPGLPLEHLDVVMVCGCVYMGI